jgi:hypothetical protein
MRRELPTASFTRTTDGDGMALIEVQEGGELSLIVYAGEEDSQAPLNEGAEVEVIWAYGKRYKTAHGVCPGMHLAEAATIYGSPVELSMSELEMREYVDFPNQPEGISFRATTRAVGIAGRYPDGMRRTNNFEPSAIIGSIIISK